MFIYSASYDDEIIDCHWCNNRKLRPWCTLLCSLCRGEKTSTNIAMPRREYKRIYDIQMHLYHKWVDETNAQPDPKFGWLPCAPESIYPKMGDEIYR